MPGLVPGIHVVTADILPLKSTWMAGTSPAMTVVWSFSETYGEAAHPLNLASGRPVMPGTRMTNTPPSGPMGDLRPSLRLSDVK